MVILDIEWVSHFAKCSMSIIPWNLHRNPIKRVLSEPTEREIEAQRDLRNFLEVTKLLTEPVWEPKKTDTGQDHSLIDYGPFSQFRDAHEQVNAPGCRFQVDSFGLFDTESWLHRNMLYKMILRTNIYWAPNYQALCWLLHKY